MTNQSIKNAFARMREHIIIALDEKVNKEVFNNTLNDYYLKTEADTLHTELHDYVDTEVAALVNAAPETLDTLGELAAAFKENKEVVETLDEAITNKLDASTFAEHLTSTALILSSPNGTKFKITIGDDGVLTATEITE